MPKITSRKEREAIAAEYGLTPMPADHPFYSEGPSITSLSRMPKRSGQKDTNSDKAIRKKNKRGTVS